jgi:hypothetical protein
VVRSSHLPKYEWTAALCEEFDEEGIVPRPYERYVVDWGEEEAIVTVIKNFGWWSPVSLIKSLLSMANAFLPPISFCLQF